MATKKSSKKLSKAKKLSTIKPLRGPGRKY